VSPVALPNPVTEGIGRLALQALTAIGGEPLRQHVSEAKQRAGETILTEIHHRQSPAWLIEGKVDVAVVWETESRHHVRLGTLVDEVRIGPAASLRGDYAAAILTAALHRETAAAFLSFLTGSGGQGVYARHGFTTKLS
jgi:molybdate transport system substrate-binding protein